MRTGPQSDRPEAAARKRSPACHTKRSRRLADNPHPRCTVGNMAPRHGERAHWRRLADTDLYLPAKIRIESHGRVLELDYRRISVDGGLQRAVFFSGFGEP